MPWPVYQSMTDHDIRAIYEYLKAVGVDVDHVKAVHLAGTRDHIASVEGSELRADKARFVFNFLEGETGIALAQQPDGFDVIVMDLSMPKVDGWEAIRRLKADERTKSIPILLLTGHPINGAADVALAQGAAGYCRKPCPPEQLEQEIEHLLAAERNA